MDSPPEALLENNLADIDSENLRHMTPSGIPQHYLRVKVGAIMMLTTNLSVADGLCNGTRVQIVRIGTNILHCLILTGHRRGDVFELTKRRFEFGGDPEAPHEGAIKCERLQFPLRPGLAITIAKSQGICNFVFLLYYLGQTLERVGMKLDHSQVLYFCIILHFIFLQCFCHGQLYTGMSRVRDCEHIRILTSHPQRRVKNPTCVAILDEEDLIEANSFPPADDPDNDNDHHDHGDESVILYLYTVYFYFLF